MKKILSACLFTLFLSGGAFYDSAQDKPILIVFEVELKGA